MAAKGDYAAGSTTCTVTVTSAEDKVAQTPVELDLTQACDGATAASATWSSTDITMTATQNGGTAVNNYMKNSQTRLYNKNTLTISPASGCEITSIEITATSSSYTITGTWSNGESSKSGAVVTVTPEDGESDVVCSITATCYLSKVKIYYKK